MSNTIRDALAQRDQQLADRVERSGLYDTPAGPLWSAAEIAQRCEQPNLHWLTWQTATLAHTHAEYLQQLGTSGPQWLQDQLFADRDAAGAMGRAVHQALNADILGAPRPPVRPEQQLFLDAFDRFCSAYEPQWESAAITVAHIPHADHVPHVDGITSVRWAGRVDFFATIERQMVIGDFTTARRLDTAALKLVGLSLCETAWVNETEVEPPDLDIGVIVHLRPDLYPDTGYRLVPVDLAAGDDTFKAAALLMHHHAEMSPLYTAPTGGA